jgi:predicted metal-dependent HD superfamily phosphohydrolase
MVSVLEKYFNDQYPKVIEALQTKLNPNYLYHNLRHTQDVIDCTQMIGKAEGLSELDLMILKIAALFHDTGFLHQRKSHEKAGVVYFLEHAEKILDPIYIDIISRCILATQMPQQPNSLIEKVICDSDLDYLGREDFFDIGADLFTEMKLCNEISNTQDWDLLQIQFLEHHRFHTHFSQTHREPVKQGHLKRLIDQSA